MKIFVKEIKEHVVLYRDSKSGIAFIKNGLTGNEHSAHPNIDRTGSVVGMKKKGYWGKNDIVVATNGAKYNISKLVIHDELDKIASEHCNCTECFKRRELKKAQ